MNKTILKIIGTVFMVLMTLSMFFYAHPSASEFVTAFFLNIFLYLKVKLPLLFLGLLLTMKKFVLGLTAIKIVIIGIKRYIIDNVITTNLNNHFFIHLIEPIKDWWRSFDLRKKLFFFVPVSILSVVSVYLTGFSNFLNFVGIKTLVVSFFKALWLVFEKILFFFTSYIWGSWFAPIIEIFIFSWLLKLLEKIPFLNRLFSNIYAFLAKIFKRFCVVQNDFVNRPIQKKLNIAGRKAAIYLKKKNRKLVKDKLLLEKKLLEKKSVGNK
jgi:hypothetical protein